MNGRGHEQKPIPNWQERLLAFLGTLPPGVKDKDVAGCVENWLRVRRMKKHRARDCMRDTDAMKDSDATG